MIVFSKVNIIPVQTLPEVGIQGRIYLIPNPNSTSESDKGLLKLYDGSYKDFGVSSLNPSTFNTSLTTLEANIVLAPNKVGEVHNV